MGKHEFEITQHQNMKIKCRLAFAYHNLVKHVIKASFYASVVV